MNDPVSNGLLALRIGTGLAVGVRLVGAPAHPDQWNPNLVAVIALVYLAFSVGAILGLDRPFRTVALVVGDLVVGGALYFAFPDPLFAAVAALAIPEAFLFKPQAGLATAGVCLLLLIQVSSIGSESGEWVRHHISFQLVVVGLAAAGGVLAERFQKVLRPLSSWEDLTRVLTSRSQLEELVQQTSEALASMFEAEAAVLYLAEETEEELKLIAWTEHPAFEDFSPQERASVLFTCYKEKQSRLTGANQGGTEQVIPEALRGSLLVAPLVVDGKAKGVGVVCHSWPRRYQSDDLVRLELVCSQLGLALELLSHQGKERFSSNIDALTDLYTHSYLQDSLGQAISEARYHNQSIALLVADIDHFSRINDRLGHGQGDSLLQQLAGVVKSTMRPQDTVCRFGPDSFAVVMPETNRANAGVAAERLRQAVEQSQFPVADEMVTVTLSGGVAAFPEDAETKKEVLEKSNEARFEAKHRGRNRICLAGQS